MPPAADDDFDIVKVYDAGSEAPATCMNTTWRMVEPLMSRRTRLQPAGAVNDGLPRAETLASRTSPDVVPAGLDTTRVVAVTLSAELAARNTGPDGAAPVVNVQLSGANGFVARSVMPEVSRAV